MIFEERYFATVVNYSKPASKKLVFKNLLG